MPKDEAGPDQGAAPATDASEQQHGDGDNAAGDVVQGDKIEGDKIEPQD